MTVEQEFFKPSPAAVAVLQALAEYRYLTTNQLLDLGVAKDRGYLGQVLASLLSIGKKNGKAERKPKEIGELDFGVKVGKGRLPRMYYLTRRGAEFLYELDPEASPPPYPPRVVAFPSDYEHRVRTVDFHITLNRWATTVGQSLDWFRRYYDWWPASEKGRQHPVTRLRLDHKNIVPDALFLLRDQAQTERMFAVEIANGMDSGRVLNQMRQYCHGLDDGSLNRALNHDPNEAIRVIYIFEHERLLQLVSERAKKDKWLQEFGSHFFLKPASLLGADFQNWWQNTGGGSEPVSLF